MTKLISVHIGVDVGGTNTDAVVLNKGDVLGFAKQSTTCHVTNGICSAINIALLNTIQKIKEDSSTFQHTQQQQSSIYQLEVLRIHIGTTHFVNAVAEKRRLATVAVIRICTPASVSLPPFSDFPQDLKKVIAGPIFMVAGGFYFDGTREISPLNKAEIIECIMSIKKAGIKNIVISGIFSPVNNSHEVQVGEWVKEYYPEASFTLSHKIAQINILFRENSAIINESLKPLANKTVNAMGEALAKLGLKCPFFLTQNDGTLLSAEKAKEMPVLTFASGPTNSMRGAAFLSGVRDGVVMDIGGTTTDAGVVMNGFPRQASSKVEICKVKTNFQMPDTSTIALGGGSKVYISDGDASKVQIGPESVGYRIHKESVVFGGDTLTTTDVAVASNICDIGTHKDRILNGNLLSNDQLVLAGNKFHEMLETLIDSVKICKVKTNFQMPDTSTIALDGGLKVYVSDKDTSEEEVPAILVGGGTLLVDKEWKPKGVSQVLRPPYYEVANAVGAALSQVSGSVDTLESLTHKCREEAVESAKKQAIELAIKEGADPKTIEIVQLADIPLTYVPGNVTRIIVKAIGDLAWESQANGVLWDETMAMTSQYDENEADFTSEMPILGIESLQTAEDASLIQDVDENPHIDPATGEWYLSINDINSIEIGAGIMGCGGGGSPLMGKLRAIQVLQKGKSIRVISPERFCQDAQTTDVVLPIGYMGAPTVWMEMLVSGVDSRAIVQATEDLYTLDEYDDTHIINIDYFRPISNMLMEMLVSGVESRAIVQATEDLYTLDEYEDTHIKNIDDQEIKVEEGIKYIEDYKPKNSVPFSSSNPSRVVRALCGWESGGCNCMAPLYEGGELDLPVVDCDLMGRAFPEIQMITSAMNGHPPYPACVSDIHDQRCVCLHADSPKRLEDHFRQICVDMGCMSALSISPLRACNLQGKVVPHSLSRAWKLGQAVLQARRHKTSPISAILEFCGGILLFTSKFDVLMYCMASVHDKCLPTGPCPPKTSKICDVERKTEGGFAKGQMRLEGFGDYSNETFTIKFQNENLIAKHTLTQKTLACVPDLITMVDSETGEPISTDEVRYGLRVAVLALPAPPILTTPQALAVIGPKAFGYMDEEYIPVGEYVEHGSVPPS